MYTAFHIDICYEQWHSSCVETYMYLVNPNWFHCIVFNVVSLQPARCANQIEEVCKEIEKTINQTIQNTLNTLEKDCEKIADTVDKKLTIDTYV